MAQFSVVNPATEQVLACLSETPPEDVREAVAQARAAQRDWARLPVEARAGLLRDFAGVVESRRRELAETISREIGKPVSQALQEVDKCAWACKLLAKEAPAWLATETVPLEGGKEARVIPEPAGVVGVISPWNFPLWQPIRSLAPALLAGNSVVFKPAEESALTAMAFRRCFEEAQLPRGALKLVLGGAVPGEALVTGGIDVLAFTGSAAAGKRVAQLAAPGFTRTVLELGGSDPFLVLEDADMRLAVKEAVDGRFRNAGQICICAKRFFVHSSRHEEFVRGLVAGAESLRLGDPLDPGTQLGPLVTAAQRENLHRQVRESARAGARVVTGGAPLPRKGFYYPATVLEAVRPEMPVMREETFGPVGPVMPFETVEEAIRLANATDFGLGANVFTRDPRLALDIAARLEAGVVAINSVVHSDPRLPFGGVKQSGIGRELGKHGMLEFCRLKTVTRTVSGP